MSEKNQVMDLLQRAMDAEQAATDKGFEFCRYRANVNRKMEEINDLVIAIREDIAEIEGRGEVSHTAVKSFWEHIAELQNIVLEVK